ncbi:MAG: extracellular solute-binding protein [Eubacteriales bacterium]|nr:extracellular solute-binding protein [Eubacteriales bacterium]
MKKSKFTKMLAFFLVTAILFGSFAALTLSVSAADPEEETIETDDSSEMFGYTRTIGEVRSLMEAASYAKYSDRYSDIPKGSKSIIIDPTQYNAEETDAEVEIYKNFEGHTGDSLYMADKGKTTWTFNVPETGRYAMRITYYPVKGTNTTIERMLYIDGMLPFSEARYFYFPRVWEYILTEDGGFDIDVNGNDIRPVRQEKPSWQTYYLRDWLGYVIDPFEFYLSEGEHTISFEAAREPIVLSSIEFYRYEEEAPYADVLAGWQAAGLQPVTDVDPIKIQAEKPQEISIQNMFPANDRTSALSEPQDPTVITYNIMDFGTVGQYIRYEVDVPKEGLYQINVRFRQNSLIGMFTSRRVRINGDIQFREASHCRFVFGTAFQSGPLNDGTTDFLFHFKEGKNIVEFEVVLGEMTHYVYQIEQMIEELNAAYKKILMITGPAPDAYRDYGFDRIVPDAVETIAKSSRDLYDISDQLVEITGELGDQVATLQMYALLFKTMAEDEYEIAPNFITFKNYIVSLSNWLYAALAQPLKMDYFTIQSPEAKPPKAVANFFEAAWFEMKAFVGSFFMDYITIGFRTSEDVEYDDTLTLWATSDRETSLILRRIIDSYFTPDTNVSVTIKVISAGLTEAIMAGIGPDVSFMSSVDTITWGLRTAVEELNQFEGYDEVQSWFTDAALIPLTIYGTTYGLPTNMSFNMAFYRLDVLAELGLDIPKTWDDLYDMLPVIQNKHLQIGMPVTATVAGSTGGNVGSLAGTNIFLYQNGTTLYADDGMRVNLDDNKALASFESLTNFFTKYSCPVVWDVSRFRTGEIPLIIGDGITLYNQLMGFAELRGLWEMAPLLGVRQEDGTINCTSVTTVSSIIIPRGAANPETSWKYLKWYVSEHTQKQLINETIAVAAPTTKVNTANIGALLNQPWTSFEYEAITTQVDQLEAIPEYPGGYIVGVYVNNAFMDVYNNNTDPSSAMLDRILDMNKEISRKRGEFDMKAYDVTYAGSYKDQIIE